VSVLQSDHLCFCISPLNSTWHNPSISSSLSFIVYAASVSLSRGVFVAIPYGDDWDPAIGSDGTFVRHMFASSCCCYGCRGKHLLLTSSLGGSFVCQGTVTPDPAITSCLSHCCPLTWLSTPWQPSRPPLLYHIHACLTWNTERSTLATLVLVKVSLLRKLWWVNRK